jgi:hypothetical protein
MNPDFFEWSLCRAMTPIDIIGHRLRFNLIAGSEYARKQIRAAAVGWCLSERCLVKPRQGWVCVMFFKNGEHGWFHMTRDEFNLIFSEEEI